MRTETEALKRANEEMRAELESKLCEAETALREAQSKVSYFHLSRLEGYLISIITLTRFVIH